jgi:hypothetical protein
VRWIKFLHQQSEIQPSRPATDTNNPHRVFPLWCPDPICRTSATKLF